MLEKTADFLGYHSVCRGREVCEAEIRVCKPAWVAAQAFWLFNGGPRQYLAFFPPCHLRARRLGC